MSRERNLTFFSGLRSSRREITDYTSEQFIADQALLLGVLYQFRKVEGAYKANDKNLVKILIKLLATINMLSFRSVQSLDKQHIPFQSIALLAGILSNEKSSKRHQVKSLVNLILPLERSFFSLLSDFESAHVAVTAFGKRGFVEYAKYDKKIADFDRALIDARREELSQLHDVDGERARANFPMPPFAEDSDDGVFSKAKRFSNFYMKPGRFEKIKSFEKDKFMEAIRQKSPTHFCEQLTDFSNTLREIIGDLDPSLPINQKRVLARKIIESRRFDSDAPEKSLHALLFIQTKLSELLKDGFVISSQNIENNNYFCGKSSGFFRHIRNIFVHTIDYPDGFDRLDQLFSNNPELFADLWVLTSELVQLAIACIHNLEVEQYTDSRDQQVLISQLKPLAEDLYNEVSQQIDISVEHELDFPYLSQMLNYLEKQLCDFHQKLKDYSVFGDEELSTNQQYDLEWLLMGIGETLAVMQGKGGKQGAFAVLESLPLEERTFMHDDRVEGLFADWARELVRHRNEAAHSQVSDALRDISHELNGAYPGLREAIEEIRECITSFLDGKRYSVSHR